MIAPKIYEVVDPRATGRTTKICIRVDAEFESLISPLQPDERAQLATDIRHHGPRDAIMAWAENGNIDSPVLLDGHTRLSILDEMRAEQDAEPSRLMNSPINVKVHVLDTETIPDRAAALLWILENQIGRRNLTDDQRAVIWNDIREQRSRVASEEGAAKARAAKTDSVKLAETIDKPSSVKTDTRKAIAEESKIPESKLRKVQGLKKTNPKLYNDVRTGKIALRDAKPTPRAKKDSRERYSTFG
jgi:hypothetical protein